MKQGIEETRFCFFVSQSISRDCLRWIWRKSSPTVYSSNAKFLRHSSSFACSHKSHFIDKTISWKIWGYMPIAHSHRSVYKNRNWFDGLCHYAIQSTDNSFALKSHHERVLFIVLEITIDMLTMHRILLIHNSSWFVLENGASFRLGLYPSWCGCHQMLAHFKFLAIKIFIEYFMSFLNSIFVFPPIRVESMQMPHKDVLHHAAHSFIRLIERMGKKKRNAERKRFGEGQENEMRKRKRLTLLMK